mgnify:FL=1
MYQIKNESDYIKSYKASVEDPKLFWEEIAENNFTWQRKWEHVLNFDFSKPEFKWFEGAQLNITENCIDRHLNDRGDKTAILFEPNNSEEKEEHITYKELHVRVCKFANVLKDQGIKKGDRVCIYLPMIPDLAIATLACARIGAIHSVVFAGFSSSSLAARVNDAACKMVITSDGSFRGNKCIDLKSIVDEALDSCPCVERVLVAKRTHTDVAMKVSRDIWLQPLLDAAVAVCPIEIMDAEDPLFILYTSGSTGKPKGMVHTSAGYMVNTAYTFKNVFQYEEDDVYWCTADIGWVTGHSYIVYGPLLNGATTLMFEGVPSYPDWGRFWEIVQKHRVNQFYTAPTAIRAMAKEDLSHVTKYDLSSLKLLGTVGEPINEEAWRWYHKNIGDEKCPVVDTWWQTETGSIMIAPIPTAVKPVPTFATLPLPGIQPVLVNADGEPIEADKTEGNLCIRFPWPSIARTIWGDHQRYKDTYFSKFENCYFTGDGAIRNEKGYYRITGRVDDIILVSGHNLGTAPIEDCINEHPLIAESAIVGFPDDIKGNALYGFLTVKSPVNSGEEKELHHQVNQLIRDKIGPIAKLDKIQFCSGLPKTRSGKIMRRILRKIASKDAENLGDTSTLLNPEVVEQIRDNAL